MMKAKASNMAAGDASLYLNVNLAMLSLFRAYQLGKTRLTVYISPAPTQQTFSLLQAVLQWQLMLPRFHVEDFGYQNPHLADHF